MKMNFAEEQIELLNKIGFDFDVSGELSDDEIMENDEKVSDYFAYHGINNDEVNDPGLLCEGIIDIIGDL